MTGADEQLLTGFLKSTGGFVTEQVRIWLNLPSDAAVARRMKRFVAARVVTATPVRLAEVRPVEAPLARWSPESRYVPDFSRIIYQVSQRGSGPLKATTLYTATPRLARLYGAAPPKAKRNSREHDRVLADTFLHFQKYRPEEACDWLSEAELADMFPGQVLPDAAVADGRRKRLALVVEVVGRSYRVERLVRLHNFCAALGCPYELW